LEVKQAELTRLQEEHALLNTKWEALEQLMSVQNNVLHLMQHLSTANRHSSNVRAATAVTTPGVSSSSRGSSMHSSSSANAGQPTAVTNTGNWQLRGSRAQEEAMALAAAALGTGDLASSWTCE